MSDYEPGDVDHFDPPLAARPCLACGVEADACFAASSDCCASCEHRLERGRQELFQAIRDERASVSGVAQALGIDAQEVLDCLRGQHCETQDPTCAAASRNDPCSVCCTCADPVSRALRSKDADLGETMTRWADHYEREIRSTRRGHADRD